jgi:hypothetical protein
LVQVTVVPAATFKSSGANARLASDEAPVGIVTDADEPLGNGEEAGAGDGDTGDDEYELPHAIENARAVETRASRNINIKNLRLLRRRLSDGGSETKRFPRYETTLDFRKHFRARSQRAIKAGPRRQASIDQGDNRIDIARAIDHVVSAGCLQTLAGNRQPMLTILVGRRGERGRTQAELVAGGGHTTAHIPSFSGSSASLTVSPPTHLASKPPGADAQLPLVSQTGHEDDQREPLCHRIARDHPTVLANPAFALSPVSALS